MERRKIVYMDGFDSVRDARTQSEEIFSTILTDDLLKYLHRDHMPNDVIDNVILIYNSSGIEKLDEYLMNESNISQDEREIIIESINAFEHDLPNPFNLN